MSSIVRGLLQSVTRSKHSIPHSKFLFHNTHNHDRMASEGPEDLNVTVEDEKNTSMTASVDQFHLLLQVLQSNDKPLMNGNFMGHAVAEVVHKYTGSNPIEVKVRNDRDVIVQFDGGV